MLDIALLKTAFRKLLTYAYFDKSDMVLRYNVATFAKSIADEVAEAAVFERILQVASGKDDELLQEWLRRMSLVFLPKKVVSGIDKNGENHLITNVPAKSVSIERMLIKADIPVELLIIDVAWVLLYGYKVDDRLSEDSWGNRVDLAANRGMVRKGNSLFKKYHTQYRRWWKTGIDEANRSLKEGKNVSIVCFDIENYYHSVDFDFETFLSEYDGNWPNDKIKEDRLTGVIRKIYERYWQLTNASDEEALCGRNEGKRPMSLNLLSSCIFANWFLSPLDEHISKTYKPLYYGRYVDDCMVVVESRSNSDDYKESIGIELPGLFEWGDDDRVKFGFSDKLSGLSLQEKKLYLYRFDCELPQASLEKYEDDQIERSSEYRFQTDEAEGDYGGLETVTLVNALEANEEDGRRFDILEENKYKLSVFLSKLAIKLAKYGSEYEHFDEVEKIARYFRDGLLIKHYPLWERLMTIFVLAGKVELVDQFVANVKKQIKLMDVDGKVFVKDKIAGRKVLQDCLLHHLEQSRLMALSLHKSRNRIDTLYIDTLMVRMHYNSYPLQEFTERFKYDGVRLLAKDLKYKQSSLQYKWIPYFVKLYDVVLALSIGRSYHPDVFGKAFSLYMKMNGLGDEGNHIDALVRRPANDVVSEFNTQLSLEYEDKDKLTVAVVNMDLKDDVGTLIDNYGVPNAKKTHSMLKILDQVTSIPSTNIFLLPEVSLPYYELRNYCRYAAHNNRAFTAGLEYVVSRKTVYNHVVTCLPVVLFGKKDALPVVRLKNYYAPKEARKIVGKGYRVPRNKKVYQNLYHWLGHLFTTYYCYELTSIKERSFFFGKVDAIYSPVFNKDTYYFNNIAESLVRDMHCYFILSNVSHYGDSRVTKPDSHVRMNLMKVKGGNTDDNNEIVLSTVLDIDGLRQFQQLPVSDQNSKENKERFKSTPPGYTPLMAKDRDGKRFLYPSRGWADQIVSDLSRACMEYQPVWKKR